MSSKRLVLSLQHHCPERCFSVADLLICDVFAKLSGPFLIDGNIHRFFANNPMDTELVAFWSPCKKKNSLIWISYSPIKSKSSIRLCSFFTASFFTLNCCHCYQNQSLEKRKHRLQHSVYYFGRGNIHLNC